MRFCPICGPGYSPGMEGCNHQAPKSLDNALRSAFMAGLDIGEDPLEDGEKIDEKCREDRFQEWRWSWANAPIPDESSEAKSGVEDVPRSTTQFCTCHKAVATAISHYCPSYERIIDFSIVLEGRREAYERGDLKK